MMKIAALLSVLLAFSSASTISREFTSGSYFFGTTSTGSRFYNVSAAYSGALPEVYFLCYPGTVTPIIQTGDPDNGTLVLCPAGSPNLGAIINCEGVSTFTISEYDIVESGRNAYTLDKGQAAAIRFTTAGFVYPDPSTELVSAFHVSGDRETVRFFQESDTSFLAILLPNEGTNTVTPTNYVTRVLTNGQSAFLPSYNDAWVCGSDANRNIVAYSFVTTAQKSTTPYTSGFTKRVCAFIPAGSEGNNVTFNSLMPSILRTTLQFDCTQVNAVQGGQYWFRYAAPPLSVRAVYVTNRASFFLVRQTTGIEPVCNGFSSNEGVVNVTMIVAQTNVSSAFLNAVSVSAFNGTVDPLSMILTPVASQALSYYDIASTNNGDVGVIAFDSRGSIGGIFDPSSQVPARIAVLNTLDTQQNVNVNATRFFFPAVTSGSTPLNNAGATRGPLGVLAANTLCMSAVTTAATTVFTTASSLDVYSQSSNGGESLTCRLAAGDAYIGYEAHSDTESLVLTPTNGTSLNLGTSTAVPANGPTNKLFSYPKAPAGDAILLIIKGAVGDIRAPKGEDALISTRNGERAFLCFVSTPGSNLNYFIYNNDATESNITVNYLSIAPSCDESNPCNRSNCINGVCGACTDGYSGYGCSVPPATSTSTSSSSSTQRTRTQGSSRATRASASSTLASPVVAVVLALLAILF
eukprot:TRINITY_DN447_c0_g1_i5.p1 TRINITY_DN447_c0_g1~~TRINITY_DN447_c0_g1_i5.p1  ORF type:complete len:692 (-),score=144.41 TRINITY_DN447_c0_g1_i5:163-2238(-)